jgi:hypothetical protein
MTDPAMEVGLLYFDGCPHWRITDEHLRSLRSEFGFELHHRLIESPEEAEAVGFRGSPSIIVDGDDLFSSGDQPVGLSCRLYMTPSGPAGSPTVEQITSALRARAHQR